MLSVLTGSHGMCLQDALVMDLRTTIKQLRDENRQLAVAMNKLSGGAPPSEVSRGSSLAGWGPGVTRRARLPRVACPHIGC